MTYDIRFDAKETVIENVNIFHILAGFEAPKSPKCYGNIDVIFANEISDKNVIFSLVLTGFYRILEAHIAPDVYYENDGLLCQRNSD